MTVAGLLFEVVLGFLIVRAVAWRTTITLRTIVTFTILGAAYAAFWNPLVSRLVDPFYESGAGVTFLLSLALQVMLLVPAPVRSRRAALWPRAASQMRGCWDSA